MPFMLAVGEPGVKMGLFAEAGDHVAFLPWRYPRGSSGHRRAAASLSPQDGMADLAGTASAVSGWWGFAPG
jgi:hypothetical protein